jgi:hypothetical protein
VVSVAREEWASEDQSLYIDLNFAMLGCLNRDTLDLNVECFVIGLKMFTNLCVDADLKDEHEINWSQCINSLPDQRHLLTNLSCYITPWCQNRRQVTTRVILVPRDAFLRDMGTR